MQRFTNKIPKRIRRTVVGFIGWFVLLAGIVMIPYPGPGWVVVFIGLSLLATEFDWARDLYDYAHAKYDAWQRWMARQPWYIKAVFWTLTALTVVVTLWLLNAYGLVNGWLKLGFDWVESPLFT